MCRNEFGLSRCTPYAAVGRLALIALVALITAILSPAAQAKDKPEESTRVYEYTYDEVFQASLDAMERIGLYVTDRDKEKRTIRGKGGDCTPRGSYMGNTCDLEIHIEIISSKPETRVTLEVKKHGAGNLLVHVERDYKEKYFAELQKVLATYR
jgi:hypothetical protein